MTYFDVIPKDLIMTILLKINDVDDFMQLGSIFKDVLSTAYFWDTKIKLVLNDINFSCIPQDLLDFNTSYDIILMNYGSLIHSYQELQYVLSQWNNIGNEGTEAVTAKYALRSINNFKLLRLDLLDPENTKTLMNFFTNYRNGSTKNNYLEILLFDGSKCKLNILCNGARVNYSISTSDAVNLITYLTFGAIQMLHF